MNMAIKTDNCHFFGGGNLLGVGGKLGCISCVMCACACQIYMCMWVAYHVWSVCCKVCVHAKFTCVPNLCVRNVLVGVGGSLFAYRVKCVCACQLYMSDVLVGVGGKLGCISCVKCACACRILQNLYQHFYGSSMTMALPTLMWAMAEQIAGIQKMLLENDIKQTSATTSEFYSIWVSQIHA